jgi:hypothetical protein
MGAKVNFIHTEEEFKQIMRLKIEMLKDIKRQFEQFYKMTGEDVYKRQIWRIEQKIKDLEALL